MSHIPEGELHAYLDGALAHLGEEAAGRIRAHLEGCAECRDRLEEEREIRASAEALMGMAVPGSLASPSFEEVVQRARAAPPAAEPSAPPGGPARRGPGVGWGLAWAATLAVALGVGWASRGGVRSGGEEGLPSAALAMRETAAIPAAEEAEASVDSIVSLGFGVPERADAGDPGGPGRLARAGQAEPALSQDRLAERVDLEVDEVRQAPLDQAAAVAKVEAPPPAPTSVGAVEEEGRRASAELDDVRLRSLADAAPVVAAPEGSSSEYREGVTTEPLAVPGLEILAIEPDGGVPGQPGVRILQRLHPGDTLELRYFGILSSGGARLGSGARAPIRMRDLPNPTLEPGWNQVVLRRGAGWLVARAPMSRESLEFLLRVLN